MQCKLILSWNQQLLWNYLKFFEILKSANKKYEMKKTWYWNCCLIKGTCLESVDKEIYKTNSKFTF